MKVWKLDEHSRAFNLSCCPLCGKTLKVHLSENNYGYAICTGYLFHWHKPICMISYEYGEDKQKAEIESKWNQFVYLFMKHWWNDNSVFNKVVEVVKELEGE